MAVDIERIANLDQVASVRRSVVDGDAGASWRAIDLAMDRGFTLRLLPDRGLDAQNATWRGTPLAWIGAAGEAPARRGLDGHDWLKAFSGGLVTTCGLANVGEPSEGHGLHGQINHCRAGKVKTDRAIVDGEVVVVVSGEMVEKTIDGTELRLKRRYTLTTGQASMLIEDEVENRSSVGTPAPFLYHVNFGWPFVDERLEVDVKAHAGVRTVFGDPNDVTGGWRLPGAPMTAQTPVTLEHNFSHEGDVGMVTLRSPTRGVAVELTWSRDTLPRLFQWINCLPRQGVVAIEPSNATTEGRAADRAQGRLATLAPSTIRKTWLRLRASPLT